MEEILHELEGVQSDHCFCKAAIRNIPQDLLNLINDRIGVGVFCFLAQIDNNKAEAVLDDDLIFGIEKRQFF